MERAPGSHKTRGSYTHSLRRHTITISHKDTGHGASSLLTEETALITRNQRPSDTLTHIHTEALADGRLSYREEVLAA